MSPGVTLGLECKGSGIAERGTTGRCNFFSANSPWSISTSSIPLCSTEAAKMIAYQSIVYTVNIRLYSYTLWRNTMQTMVAAVCSSG